MVEYLARVLQFYYCRFMITVWVKGTGSRCSHFARNFLYSDFEGFFFTLLHF